MQKANGYKGNIKPSFRRDDIAFCFTLPPAAYSQ
jgi:hypothetical protein